MHAEIVTLIDPKEGLKHFEKTLSCAQKSFDPIHIQIAIAHNNLGATLLYREDFQQATQHLEQAQQMFAKLGLANNPLGQIAQANWKSLYKEPEAELNDTTHFTRLGC